VGRVSRINPVFAAFNPVDETLAALIFEGLVTTNARGEPAPGLAERWVISNDGLEYVLFLRRNVLWHDGTPFTANDVAYTMSILSDAQYPGPSEVNAFWRTVETQVLDAHTVRFRLAQPLGMFLDRLRVGILPEHALRGTGAAALAAHPFNLAPIGTGPYQLAALRVEGSQIVQVELAAAPVYEQRTGTATGLRLMAFPLYETFEQALAALENQQLDALAGRSRADRTALFRIASTGDYFMNNQLENALGILIFNWANPDTEFFRDQRVRVALQAGLDRQSIIERVLANVAVPADSPLTPSSWAYRDDLDWATYDPAYARTLLDLAVQRLNTQDDAIVPTQPPSFEVAPGVDPTPLPTATPLPTNLFTFSVLVPDDPGLVAFASEMATQWAQLSLQVTVDAVDVPAYLARLEAGDFDTAIVEYALGNTADPDVYALWHQGAYPDGENFGGLDDRRISALLERARRDPFGINRIADYHAFQQQFASRALALPLYYPVFTFLTAQRVLNVQLGFIGTPTDRYRNVTAWSLAG
jgi:peptide/nickel transport system substrate-binding protein